MKSVLLLGGFGFLGTNVMKYAEKNHEEYRFIVFDKFEHHQAGISFRNIYKVYAGDFSDYLILEKVFKENEIDCIFHSLSTTVPIESNNTRFDIESNLIPTIGVFDLMVKYAIKDIVYFSSGGAIYGTTENKLHTESEDVFPVSSYGVVKLAIEKYLMQYAQLYGISPLILRLSNPYGPYHYSMRQGIINVALTKALKEETLEIWGDGTGKKDYIYVLDFVNILFSLLKIKERNLELQTGRVLNIASGELLSVNEIAEAVKGKVPGFKVLYKPAKKFDVSHFELDTDKLIDLLPDKRYGFTSFEDGLEKTYRWTKEMIV